MKRARISIVRAKSVLNRTNLPAVDYSVNPYVGCEHACKYCYAANVRRYSGHSGEPWGEFLDVKINAPAILRKQLRRRRKGPVLVGSVTDPYTPAELEFRIARGILEVLLEFDFPVTILTKSDLVERDVDLFQRFTNVSVGFTINHLDERLTQLLEPGAPPMKRRIRALRSLRDAGVDTYVFVAPVIPFITDIDGIAEATGAADIRLDKLNIGSRESKSWLRLREAIYEYDPQVAERLEGFLRKKAAYYSEMKQQHEGRGYTWYS